MGYARIAAEHGDIKVYLARCAAEKEAHEAEFKRQQYEQQRLAALEASRARSPSCFATT